MRLRRLEIENFRGVRALDWRHIAETAALVGPGDSGKSTILDAIERVLSPKWNVAFDDTDFWDLDVEKPVVICATLTDLAADFYRDTKFGLLLHALDKDNGVAVRAEGVDDEVYALVVELRVDASLEPVWSVLDADGDTPGAEKICRTVLGKRVLNESYNGVVVDEYQDCTLQQHALVQALAACIPCRGVGDPLQTIFGFRNDPVVPWATIKTDFEVVDNALTEPWRWRRKGRNAPLGDWLVAARTQLEKTGRVVIADDAPVTWVQHHVGIEASEAWATSCRNVRVPAEETVVAILKWSNKCPELAKRMGGRWPMVERFDDPDLLRLGVKLVDADGPMVVSALVDFISERMTGMGTALKTAVDAIAAGRGVSRITKNRDHADRLSVLANTPTPANALAWLEGVLAHRGDWWLYRRECVFQLREALRHCDDAFAELPDMVANARTRARHRGRHTHRRTIGTPLLVKGLEFDHAVLLWEPDHLSVEGLYVALTRAAKSLTIVSRSRTLVPDAK